MNSSEYDSEDEMVTAMTFDYVVIIYKYFSLAVYLYSTLNSKKCNYLVVKIPVSGPVSATPSKSAM
jgi:hypothetical protein